MCDEVIMKMGEIYRYSKKKDWKPKNKDGLPNYFHYTYTEKRSYPLLEKGINPIGGVSSDEGIRCPAILISSSPHKIGTQDTPWQDIFDSDNGHIKYYGDNKSSDVDPSSTPGNKILLEQYKYYSSLNVNLRRLAAPLLFFRRIPYQGRKKGNVKFCGYGIISRIERISQIDPVTKNSFINYSYDFLVFNLEAENEKFNWEWISSRRNPKNPNDKTLKMAPSAWKIWVKSGMAAENKVRRRVSKLMVCSTIEQIPIKKSREEKTLLEILKFYGTKPRSKLRFEALASKITANVIKESSGNYKEGWITPPGSDGGSDFVGRLDIGHDFGRAKIIVLGQAKCEKYNSPTGGNHIARTIARLRRGWLGVYVTTSYFSESVQREIIEDKYPILLINGLKLARIVNSLILKEGFKSLRDFLEEIDNGYEGKIARRNPEEILLD